MACHIRPPRRKPRAPQGRPVPLPIPLASVTGLPASNARWACYHGHVNDKTVVVKNIEHAEEIYNKGYFGHWSTDGDVSYNETTPSTAEDAPQLVTESPTCAETESEEVIVLSGSDDDDTESTNVRNLAEPETSEKILCLTLEEAFFLLYALGCLVVFDGEKKLNVAEMWDCCGNLEPAFVVRYVAYHYFRSKGWVVRHESGFGCDYLLYKYGPPYYHASYSVLLQIGKNECLAANNLGLIQKLTWVNLNALNRITEHVGKELLIAYVNLNVSNDDLKQPSCIKKCEVQTMLFRRWISSQEREGDAGR